MKRLIKKHWRSLLPAFLASMLVLMLWPATAKADGETVYAGNYICTVIDGGTALRLDGYKSEPTGSVTLPDSADTGSYGYGVLDITQIAGVAFRNCTNILDITLPARLVSIGDNAFQNCGTYYVAFPSTLKTIGYYAFDGCTHLQNVTLPGSLQSIGGCAFAGCTLINAITIPDSVTGMGDSAFSGCFRLESAVLPNNAGFTAIPDNLFYGCQKLASVTIPAGVTSIGNYSFYGTGFSTFEVPKNITSINYTAFGGCYSHTSFTVEAGSASFAASDGALYTADMKTLFLQPFKKSSLNVPEGVTEIGANACRGCIYLNTVTLPGTLTKIGDYAFENTGISSVRIPAGVTSVGEWAFQNTRSAKITVLNDTATFSGDYVFAINNVLYGRDGSTIQAYSAAHNLTFVLLLELSASPASGQIYTGGRIVITPNVEDGTWDWDEEYLSATFNSPATFTGLKEGTTTVTYTAGGQTATYDITISKSSLPQTGQDFTWAWALCGAALVLAAAGVLMLKRKAAKQ